MKKLIIKTIAFSIGILVAGFALFYLIMATASPSSLGDFYYRTGNERLAIKYSEKAYEKSEDIGDLATLVERSASLKRHALVKEYGFLLINHAGYDEFSKAEGAGYKYYVAGSICQSLYILGETSASVDTAFNQTAEYNKVNPVRVIIALAYENGDKVTLASILVKLEARQNKNEYCQNDISIIRDYLK